MFLLIFVIIDVIKRSMLTKVMYPIQFCRDLYRASAYIDATLLPAKTALSTDLVATTNQSDITDDRTKMKKEVLGIPPLTRT